MRQAAALGLKLAVYLVIFGVSMPVFGLMGVAQSMVLAAVHTLLLWLSDLTVLPRFGGAVAAAADAMTLIVGSFLVLGAMWAVPNPAGLTLAVVLGTAFETWFHRWLLATGVVR